MRELRELALVVLLLFAGTRGHLVDHEEAYRTFLRLAQVLLIHVILVANQADGLQFGSFTLNDVLLALVLDLQL